MRKLSVALLGGSALALCLLLAGPAAGEDDLEGEPPKEEKPQVGLGVGDRAVAFEGKDFFNTDPVTWKALRGRLILLELFSTT